MQNRGHRPQVSELIGDDTRPLVVRPLVQTDRLHNPDDIEPDVAAMAAGVSHGGNLETRVEALQVRGAGGRRRSGPRARYRGGREVSKAR